VILQNLQHGETVDNSISLLFALTEFFDDRGIPYFVDSGTLLGIVRDGGILASDRDLDIGLFKDGAQQLIAARESLRERGIFLRCSVYRGNVYSLSIGWRRRRNLVLHAHVYTRSSAGIWWHPQVIKHFKWPGIAGAILAARRDGKRLANAGNSSSASDRAEPPHLRNWSAKIWSRVAFPSFPLYTLSKLAMQAMGRVDRSVWAGAFPGRALYSSFTWIVPARFFDELDESEWRGQTLRVPSNCEQYLARRYGEDWKTSNADWVFFLDDHSIFAECAETLIPRLERAGGGDDSEGPRASVHRL
jgi:hypothetical protein